MQVVIQIASHAKKASEVLLGRTRFGVAYDPKPVSDTRLFLIFFGARIVIISLLPVDCSLACRVACE